MKNNFCIDFSKKTDAIDLSMNIDNEKKEVLEKNFLNLGVFGRITLDAINVSICILDKTGNIIAVNQAWKDFYDINLGENYHKNYCIGMNYLGVCHTSTGLYSEEAGQMATGIVRVMNGKLDEFTLEYPCNSPNEMRWFLSRVTRLKEDNDHFLITHETITDRKLAEEKIQNLLNAKSELDHHVKNDMSTIFNLLMIQSNKQNANEAKAVLLEAAGYIRSMIVLYNKLYHTEIEKSISNREYFISLIEEIIQIFPQGKNIRLSMQIEDVSINSKKLSTIGLIINELITNAVKHAFTNHCNPELSVTIFQAGEMVTILFADNGSTIPDNISLDNSPGFGLKLIGLLVKQIKGSLSISRRNGTHFTLQFKS